MYTRPIKTHYHICPSMHFVDRKVTPKLSVAIIYFLSQIIIKLLKNIENRKMHRSTNIISIIKKSGFLPAPCQVSHDLHLHIGTWPVFMLRCKNKKLSHVQYVQESYPGCIPTSPLVFKLTVTLTRLKSINSNFLAFSVSLKECTRTSAGTVYYSWTSLHTQIQCQVDFFGLSNPFFDITSKILV